MHCMSNGNFTENSSELCNSYAPQQPTAKTAPVLSKRQFLRAQAKSDTSNYRRNSIVLGIAIMLFMGFALLLLMNTSIDKIPAVAVIPDASSEAKALIQELNDSTESLEEMRTPPSLPKRIYDDPAVYNYYMRSLEKHPYTHYSNFKNSLKRNYSKEEFQLYESLESSMIECGTVASTSNLKKMFSISQKLSQTALGSKIFSSKEIDSINTAYSFMNGATTCLLIVGLVFGALSVLGAIFQSISLQIIGGILCALYCLALNLFVLLIIVALHTGLLLLYKKSCDDYSAYLFYNSL